MKAFISWSGGKDTSLSCYRVMQNQDIEAIYLLNMISSNGERSRSHGVSSMLLKTQSEAIGIPIVQRKTAWQRYEEEFKKALSDLMRENVEAGVFGDIYLQEHRDWLERACKESGIKAIFPLWGGKTEEIIQEFIDSGFEAIVVATKADILGPEWLGRRINEQFVSDLKSLGQIDLCGERGEYHTFVVDGPIFKERIDIIESKKVKRNNCWFLDILKYSKRDK